MLLILLYLGSGGDLRFAFKLGGRLENTKNARRTKDHKKKNVKTFRSLFL